MRSVNFGITLAAQGVLGDGLDDPAMWRAGRGTQNEVVPAAGMKEARIGGVLWPAVDDEVEPAPGLSAGQFHNMVEAQMLGNKRGKSRLAESDKLVTRQAGRWSSTKAGVVGVEVESQATP